ncbi:hydrogenase maturation nickel metallochaperone HypA [Mobiluncus mulieris]|uniref:hydrogenase maturation nickel metallochaperone HypA/HybF n=1 Tax=Mobiluncus mulieris TaxID=2052 RepID=UPI00242C031F|nr:hydrogenase maturation nickel metallochaperone HypA [Mobiluncus mulieris]
MHELGLLTAVVEAILQAADTASASKVNEVSLKVGTLSGAVPEALYGAWPIATDRTICEDAQLRLNVIPATVYCSKCRQNVTIDEFFALLCPVCATPTGQLATGREFEIEWVEWDCPDTVGAPAAGTDTGSMPATTNTSKLD